LPGFPAGRFLFHLGRSAAVHLPKHLLFAMLAYRIQADAFGDLDVDGADIEGHWIRRIGCDH
jgi:hypothetical protein